MPSCARKLRERIDNYLPPQLQEAVVVPDDLRCERRMVIVNGPSGVGKTELVRSQYPSYVSVSVDHLQYTGPCRKRLFEARKNGPDEDLFTTCEDLGGVVSEVVTRESFKAGANVVLEETSSSARTRAPSYEREFLLVFRPFEEAYANVIARHHDMSKTSVPWAAKDFVELRDYLLRNFVPHMQQATLTAAIIQAPVRVISTKGNRARKSTLKAALNELARALVFLRREQHGDVENEPRTTTRKKK